MLSLFHSKGYKQHCLMTFVKEDMELVQVVFLGHVKEKLRFRGEQESFLPLLFKMDSHWHCLPAYLRNSFS